MIELKRLVLVCMSLAVAASLLGSCGRPAPEEKIEFQAGEFTSAERCGSCHKDIYAAWRNSLHAASAENPIFKASYAEAVQSTGGQATLLCLTCHAPTVVITKDYELAQTITREGVTCDFCHSLKGAELAAAKNPFVLEVGPVKFGPIPDATSTAHQVAFSDFHNHSLHCAGCHEYKNSQGVALLSTYSEWEQYGQQGGTKSCQQCHMPQVLADVVDPKVKRVQGGFVNLHLMPGGHSRDQLVKSLRMRITQIERTAGGVAVKVTLNNAGAGHMVPTGLPTRKVILSVDASTDRGDVAHAESVFQRVVLNGQGQELTRDSQIFTEAQTIARDTRIAPAEQRTEEFLLAVPADANVTVKATLTYLYSPQDRKVTEIRIDFYSEQKELLSRWTR